MNKNIFMSGRNYLKDIRGDIPNLKLTTVNHAKLHNKHVGLGASLAHRAKYVSTCFNASVAWI